MAGPIPYNRQKKALKVGGVAEIEDSATRNVVNQLINIIKDQEQRINFLESNRKI